MKKKKSDLSVSERMARCAELEREIFDLRNDLALNRKLEKPHLLKAKRREKARMLTMLTQEKQKGKVA